MHGHTIDDLNIMPIEEVTREGSVLVQGTLHNLSLWPKLSIMLRSLGIYLK